MSLWRYRDSGKPEKTSKLSAPSLYLALYICSIWLFMIYICLYYAVKCCNQYASKFGKLSSGHRTGKGQFSFQSLRKAIPKNAQTTTQLLVKWCSKFSRPGFSNTWTMNFQMFKLVLEKAEEPEIKLPISAGLSKKQESSRKTSISALLTMPKPLTVWITMNYGKFWKRWEYQTIWSASWETCMQVRKQWLELYMEQ